MFLFGLMLTTGLAYAVAPVVEYKNPCDVSVERCIAKYFPEQPELTIAIAKAESGLNINAVGINSDSVDCGLMQINVKGNICPKELFQIDFNLKQARLLYEKRGYHPWVVFNTGAYKKYLAIGQL